EHSQAVAVSKGPLNLRGKRKSADQYPRITRPDGEVSTSRDKAISDAHFNRQSQRCDPAMFGSLQFGCNVQIRLLDDSAVVHGYLRAIQIQVKLAPLPFA